MDHNDMRKRTRHLHDAAEFLQRAVRDAETREAAAQVFEQGRRVYSGVSGSGPRGGAGKLVRDARLQKDLAAMIRSAAESFDAGARARKRRGRRTVIWSALAAIAGVVIWRRAAIPAGDQDRSDNGHTGTTPVDRESARPTRV